MCDLHLDEKKQPLVLFTNQRDGCVRPMGKGDPNGSGDTIDLESGDKGDDGWEKDDYDHSALCQGSKCAFGIKGHGVVVQFSRVMCVSLN